MFLLWVIRLADLKNTASESLQPISHDSWMDTLVEFVPSSLKIVENSGLNAALHP